MTSPSPAPAGRPTDETGEALLERASARPWWFDGRDVFHKSPGTNLDQIIIPLGHVLSDTFTASGAVNPADIELAVEAVNAYAALSVLAARAHGAEKALEELRDAARPFGEMAQEMLNGHPTGRLKRGDPERLLTALAGRVGAEQDSEA